MFICSPLIFRRTNSLQVGCGNDIGGIILINMEHWTFIGEQEQWVQNGDFLFKIFGRQSHSDLLPVSSGIRDEASINPVVTKEQVIVYIKPQKKYFQITLRVWLKPTKARKFRARAAALSLTHPILFRNYSRYEESYMKHDVSGLQGLAQNLAFICTGQGLPVELELTKPSHGVEDYMTNKLDLCIKC